MHTSRERPSRCFDDIDKVGRANPTRLSGVGRVNVTGSVLIRTDP